MKNFYPIFIILFLVQLAFVSNAQTEFKAMLSGSHEVLPVATSASGEITATLNGNQLEVSGSFSGLTGLFDATVAGGSHIHTGYAGANGGITFTLMPTLDLDLKGGTFSAMLNTFTLNQDQMDALMERRFYINIHTTAYGGGELRGQLLPSSDAFFNTNLLGSNEVPSIMTRASGALTLELAGDQLTVTGAFSGLESDFNTAIAGGAHLHLGYPGQNGGVQIRLNATADMDNRGGVFAAADNTFTLTATQMDALMGGQMYANIHTTVNTGGEIRGQVVGQADAILRAHLSGANENPVVTSGAAGVVNAEIRGDSLIVFGSFAGLESTVATAIAGGAHIHTGKAGENGGVLFRLNATFDANMQGGIFAAANNRFELSADQKAMLLARGMYVNIHTQNNQGGELRGQLLPDAQIVLNGMFSGTFEVPSIISLAKGAVKAELLGDKLTISGTFDNLSSPINVAIAGGAHIHLGAAGTNGGVIRSLTFDPNVDLTGATLEASANTFTLTEDEITAFRNRGLYLNVHTINFASGEVRTQLLAEANYYMNAPLSGASESIPVNTDASGAVILEVRGENAIAVGGFSGLSSDLATDIAGGAHIHYGFAGQNGAIALLLNATLNDDNRSGVFAAIDNNLALNAGKVDTLRHRMFYVNVHSTNNQGGELRGQALPVSTAYLTSTLAGLNEVQPVSTSARGALKMELNGSVLTTTGSFQGLQGDFDASIGGGAHLHLAGPGANGGVDLLLNTTAAANLKSGVYEADSNRIMLNETQIMSLVDGGYYANIHTTAFPSGELRGQALTELNFFPEAGGITFPPDGGMLTLEGVASALFEPSWAAGDDENDLAYIWQLAVDQNFNLVVFQQNVGNELSLMTTLGAVDTLLANAGLPVGGSITLYHRVLASDGSLATASAASSVTLTRGTITSTQDLTPGISEFVVYPTITSNFINYRVAADENTQAQFFISDANGRLLQQRKVQLNARSSVNESFNVNNLPAGNYFLSIKANNSVATRPFIIKN